MFLNDFYAESEGGYIVSAEQASRFAKEIAGDFNPIHDPDSKRFCVPGDLLFSLVLARYGLCQQMAFNFIGMVDRDIKLLMPKSDADELDISGDTGKTYLKVTRKGECSTDAGLIEAFSRSYVAFSGHNFPDLLVPLMNEHKVMVNTQRPLIIYESMSFDLEHHNFVDPVLKLSSSELEVNGKRGNAYLYFDILSGGARVGSGIKKLVLSGLRDYEHGEILNMIAEFERLKANYRNHS